jgi:thiol-disulfide isomerase/thioredoxin
MFGQGFSFSGYERDPLYLNLGGKKFTDISGISGIDSITDGRAGVFADFDNDGDLDVFSTTIQNQAHLLFRNNVGQDNGYLRISLEGGAGSPRDAFGSVVRVKTKAGILTKIKSGGSGFISQHDPRLYFGLGRDDQAEWVEVTWANGKVERFAGEFTAGGSFVLKEGTGKARAVTVGTAKLPDPLTKTEIFARSLKIAVGKRLPDLPLKRLNGTAVPISRLFKSGRSTLINIWATWCLPCAKEMPELEKIRSKLSARKIDIIGLNVDIEGNANIRKYAADRRITYPIFTGGVRAIERIYATDELTVPLSILIDERGIVRELIPGWSAETQKRFQSLAGESAEPVRSTAAGPAN